MSLELFPRHSSSGSVTGTTRGGWRLNLPPGQRGAYRLAQLDDYTAVSRRAFHWSPPLTFSLRARVSRELIPGTWGFGFWNDPFSVSFGLGGMARRLPALPNTAWFFFASPPNYLSLRDDIPAQGFLAATFCSPNWPPLLLAPGLLVLPLLAIRPFARLVRRLASSLIKQDAGLVELDSTEWHDYTLEWLRESCTFEVDQVPIFKSTTSPHGPLGLVIWIDNQYAAFNPKGSIKIGALENPLAAWLEITEISVTQAG